MRKLFMLSLCVLCLSVAGQSFAEDIFITSRGAKYHKDTCRLLKNKENVTMLEKKEAIEEDYGPCRRCFKEDVVVESDVSNSEHQMPSE